MTTAEKETIFGKTGPSPKLHPTFEAGQDYPDPRRVWMIDGGMGTEIQRQNPGAVVSEAWSGMAQLKDPALVRSIHQEYLKAGADIIIANSYASNAHVLGKEARDAEEVRQCSVAACECAFQACAGADKTKRVCSYVGTKRKEAGGDAPARKIWIAGSISTHPPLFFSKVQERCEKGEKHDDINPTEVAAWPSGEEELENYKKQARTLKEGKVDMIALEMMKDTAHATRACTAAAEAKLPIFLGITTSRGADGTITLRDDPSVEFGAAVTGLLAACGGLVVCVNIMHSPVDEILPTIDALRKVYDGPVGIYPNNARSTARLDFDGEAGYTDEEFAAEAVLWAQTGSVSFIGGCCGTRPSHIAAARASLADAGFL